MPKSPTPSGTGGRSPRKTAPCLLAVPGRVPRAGVDRELGGFVWGPVGGGTWLGSFLFRGWNPLLTQLLSLDSIVGFGDGASVHPVTRCYVAAYKDTIL